MKPRVSRRGFLQTAAAAPAAPAAPAPSSFGPKTKPRRISENLYVLEDTCNVYVVRDGDHALLIDFGSGAILRHLGDLGVSRVEWILHTHHHRDQAQGDHKAVRQRIPIAAPAHERHLFENAENFWRNRSIFHVYNVRNDFFSLTRNVPLAAVLRDYETFRWRGRELFIRPAPGHTPGSIAIVTEIDGRRVAFSGDLMHSPGKVQTLYDLQYFYGEQEGVDLSIYSLTELVKLKPALLCPSHGAEVPDPIPGMEQLISKLDEWWHFWKVRPVTSQAQPVPLTPHVIANSLAMATFYAIVSDSGKALFIDYGTASPSFWEAFLRTGEAHERIRFVEHGVEAMRARHGLRSIDAAMPTHVHDDHVNGFPHLARRYGTKIWCYENMAEILENPRGRNVACLLGEPMKVERTFRDGETFRWEEFEFTMKHSPGHTNFQMALFSTIDGKRIAFTGDAFFNDAARPSEIRHNLIYRNDVRSGDHAQSIRNILDFDPQIIAPGHGQPFAINREMALRFEEKMRRQDRFFRELIADPDTDFGLDPSWAHIFPYQSVATPGGTLRLELRMRNHRSRPIDVEAVLVMPSGWAATPASIRFTVGARASGRSAVSVRVPPGWRGQRLAIAADVAVDGRHLGEIAEAVVDVRSGRA